MIDISRKYSFKAPILLLNIWNRNKDMDVWMFLNKKQRYPTA